MKDIGKKGGRKPQKSFGEELIQAMDEVIAIERGEAQPAAVRRYAVTARHVEARPAPELGADDVREIREQLAVSQPVFAAALNVSPETVKAWEQSKMSPGGAAARLLQIVRAHPNVIEGTILPRKPSRVATHRGHAAIQRMASVGRGGGQASAARSRVTVAGKVLSPKGSGRGRSTKK